MYTHRRALYIFRIVSDLFSLFLAFSLSLWFYKSKFPFNWTNLEFLFLLILLISWFFSAKSNGLYDEFRSRNFSFELILIIKTLIVQILVSAVILFFIKEINLTRYFILPYTFTLFGFLVIQKFIIRKVLNFKRKRGRNLRNILIVGAGEVGKQFYDSIRDNPHFGYRLVGFLDDENKLSLNGQYLGKIEELESTINKYSVDDVIIALPNYAQEKLNWVIETCFNTTTRVRIIPDYFRISSDSYSVSVFGKFPLISIRNDKINEFHWRFLKRVFDIVFSLSLFLMIFWWLWPIIAFGIKLSSSGPVLFKHERWGRKNERIITFKFRSMETGASEVDEKGNYKQAEVNDPRVTKFGKFLRKTNLDELPQFLNVLKGEMSVVGPRPHPELLNIQSKSKIKYYMQRHIVKPGITGWAQINGYRGNTKDPELMKKRVEYDIWYIEHWSFFLDIQIIILTVWRMIKGDPNAY